MTTDTPTPPDASEIQWREEFDDWDNSIWVAPSPYVENMNDDGTPEFEWRLEQLIRNNRIEWIDKSADELTGGDEETFATLAEAKEALAKCNQTVLMEIANATE